MGANQLGLKLAKSLSKMIRGFANLIQHGFVLLAYMAVLFLITLPGALVVTLCFIAVSLGLGRLILHLHENARKYLEIGLSVNRFTSEFLQGQRLIRSLGRAKYSIDLVNQKTAKA